MATTVKQLKEYLEHENPDAIVVYQYLLAEHIFMNPKKFEKVAEELEGSAFADAMTEAMRKWIRRFDR